MESIRQQKISRLLQKDLGELFQKEGASVTGKKVMITVTKVKVTKDLQLADTFLSIFGTEEKENVIETINQKTAEIRYTIGKKLRHQLRAIPQLRFFIDDSLDYIDKIDELLDH